MTSKYTECYIGRNFDALLRKNKVSVYKFCADTGFARSMTYNWRNGLVTPSVRNLCEIAEYFKVTPDWLLMCHGVADKALDGSAELVGTGRNEATA